MLFINLFFFLVDILSLLLYCLTLTYYENTIVVFSGYSVSSTNKTDRHSITEILLKVALSTITLTINDITDKEMYPIGSHGLKTLWELLLELFVMLFNFDLIFHLFCSLRLRFVI